MCCYTQISVFNWYIHLRWVSPELVHYPISIFNLIFHPNLSKQHYIWQFKNKTYFMLWNWLQLLVTTSEMNRNHALFLPGLYINLNMYVWYFMYAILFRSTHLIPSFIFFIRINSTSKLIHYLEVNDICYWALT